MMSENDESINGEHDHDMTPDFVRSHERIAKLTRNYSLPEKVLYDRQGILEGQARTLGTLNTLRTCPYNESHRVGEGRFHNHLFKCREANPEIAESMIICEYDATHHIPKEVYDIHLTLCWTRNEQEANRQKDFIVKRPTVKCSVRLVGEICDNSVTGCKEQKSSTIIEAHRVSKDTVYRVALFEGFPQTKPTNYTCWL